MGTIIALPIRTGLQTARRREPTAPCQVMLFNGVRYEHLPTETKSRHRDGPGQGGGQPKRRKLKSA